MGKGTCLFRSSGLGSVRSRPVPEWIWGFIGQRGGEGAQNLRWKESVGLAQRAGAATEMMCYYCALRDLDFEGTFRSPRDISGLGCP